MAHTNVQIRVESALKKQADKVLDNIGLDMPTAFRVFLKKIVATRSIPFSLSEEAANPYSFTPAQERAILEAAEESHEPGKWSGPFLSVAEVQTHLDSLKRGA